MAGWIGFRLYNNTDVYSQGKGNIQRKRDTGFFCEDDSSANVHRLSSYLSFQEQKSILYTFGSRDNGDLCSEKYF